ncbi:TVP38/TMEM64 family protein [Planococcus lenghuensis]|uniref:TVP38/TMEM64 family protein n=1 Tax=Planococcus lenghuensis TaxID=2213202 RepID=A0A1Q2KVQ5_9BACL|nr:VTT domain-containing protein [Planococcus lenghuensis]AQQ52194.1 TVP38/TMEM64 family protein [Planococcus lenghuensis]
MNQLQETVTTYIESAGWFAPVLFILLHMLRPLLLIPVLVVCILGGVLFGFVPGAILSFIGLSLMSFEMYVLVNRFPGFKARLDRLKERFGHGRTLSLGQVLVLRVMPFVHFNLLNVYVMEMTKSFRQYASYTLAGLVAPAILYTAFGHALSSMSWITSLMLAAVLAGIYYVIGKYHKPETAPDTAD